MARDKNFQIRVSEQEKWRIEERARGHGYRPAAFMRMLSLYGGMEVEGIPYEPPRVPSALEQRDRQPDHELQAARERIENDSSNLNVTLDDQGGLVAKETGKPMAYESPPEEVEVPISRDMWIASTARILMMEKGLSKVAATMQASKEWDERNG